MTSLIHRLVAFAAMLVPANPALARDAPGQVIPLTRVFGGQLAFSARIAGSDQLFLFDTGGGTTVISPALAAKIGCKPWGQVTGFQMRGQRLDLKRCDDVGIQVGKQRLTSATAGVFDILAGAPKDAPPIVGSIALDMFIGKAVTLDVGHKQLTIETPASLARRIAAARPLLARFERDVQGLAREALVAVDTRQGRIWLEIDCGSDGSVIVNRADAAALGLDPSNRGSQQFRLKLAGGPEIDAAGHMDDLIRDGNIGVRVLTHWIVTIDEAKERVWISPSGI